MQNGHVISIHIAPGAGEPMVSVDQVRAVPGRGLEGDRYWERRGTYSGKAGPRGAPPAREVTLIEAEALEALERDAGIKLDPGDSRRNVVTGGVALNHLVGREFRIGGVSLRGVRLCEPCAHLERLTRPGVLRALIHRGGLRAEILTPGTIRVGDPIGAGEATGTNHESREPA